MKVTKEVTFDSAHMLSYYEGKCSNLHGHTYKLQVSIEGAITTEGNGEGMVMDFNELKQYIESVTNRFDHAIIFSGENYRNAAEEALMDWAEKYGMNFVVIEGKSTSENIASYVKRDIEEMTYMQNVVVGVRIWETPTSFAEV